MQNALPCVFMEICIYMNINILNNSLIFYQLKYYVEILNLEFV